MRTYKNLLAVMFGLMLFSAANAVFAQSATGINEQENCKNFASHFIVKINNTPINTVGTLPQFCSLQDVVTKAINLALILAGSAAVVFIILGGYWMLASAGNEEQAEKGRKVLTNSIIGLVVIIMSFAIVRIVTNLLTSNAGDPSTSPATEGNNNGGINTTPNYEPGSPGDPNYVPNSVSGSGQPAELKLNDAYTLTLSIPQTVLSCGATQANVYVKVTRADGSQETIQPSSFGKSNTTTYMVTFETNTPQSYGYRLTGSELSRDAVQMPIGGYVCGVESYSNAINIVAGPSTGNNEPAESPRGSDTGPGFAAALGSFSYSVNPVPFENSFDVYIYAAGTANERQENLKKVCSEVTNQTLELSITSKKSGQPAYIKSYPANTMISGPIAQSKKLVSGISGTDYDANSVKLYLCDQGLSK